MIYFIVGITVFFIIFGLLTSKFKNPYQLIMIFGKKGSGKTTYLIRIAKKYLSKKTPWIIYTNIPDIQLDGVRLIDVENLGDFVPVSNSVLLLDEVGMIWDSRDFKKFKPSVRDFFKLQRHYKVICYLASQTFDIDKKLRDLTDSMILFTHVFNIFSLGRPIKKHIVLTEASADNESRISENLKFCPIWDWKITCIPRYSKYFNSYQLPEKPELPYQELHMPYQLKNTKNSLAKRIKKHNRRARWRKFCFRCLNYYDYLCDQPFFDSAYWYVLSTAIGFIILLLAVFCILHMFLLH